MNQLGFLQFTVCLCVFPAEHTLLPPDAGSEVEKPHHARFFPDLLRLGWSSLPAVAGGHDLRGLGGSQGDGQVLGGKAAQALAGCGLCDQPGPLCFFKYLTFFLQNFHNLFGVPETVIAITLPIGISFYTFQLLSYMVDVYRQDVEPQQNFFTLLLYVSMFHQCIAGPIVRYEHVERELTHRKILRADVAYGIRRFTVGLAKKALLANTCGSFADTFLPHLFRYHFRHPGGPARPVSVAGDAGLHHADLSGLLRLLGHGHRYGPHDRFPLPGEL